MATYQAAIASAMSPGSGKTSHSQDLVFSTRSYGTDLDPVGVILARRVAMLRRYVEKHPDADFTVRNIPRRYCDKGYVATNCDPEHLAALEPAPSPKGAGRKRVGP